MVDITEISAIVAAAGVLVGIVYYAFEFRHMNNTRDMDLVFRLMSITTTEQYEDAYTQVMNLEFKDYDDFKAKYGEYVSHAPIPIALDVVASFYEELGVLCRRKLVDINLVNELFSVKRPWEKIRPMVEGARKQLNEPTLFVGFEYLYNEMKKREQKLQQSEA